MNVWLEASAPDGITKTGESLSYSVRIVHSGECEATGVVVTHTLPVGVLFVGAESDQGEWDRNDRVLSFHLGRLAKASQTEIRVTLLPVTAGELSIRVAARINGPEVTLADNSVNLVISPLGANLPSLSIDLSPRGEFELRLIGGEGLRYDIETSSNFEVWDKAAEAEGGLWSKSLNDFASGMLRSRFFRAVER